MNIIISVLRNRTGLFIKIIKIERVQNKFPGYLRSAFTDLPVVSDLSLQFV